MLSNEESQNPSTIFEIKNQESEIIFFENIIIKNFQFIYNFMRL